MHCACPSACCPVLAMRGLVRSSAGLADELGVELDKFPLAPGRGGIRLKKEHVTQVFRDATSAVGAQGLRITGHSGRVTGAQRLAAAGVDELRIQVFGRWASSAVRRYVREATLDGVGATLALEVEAANEAVPLEELEAAVRRRVLQRRHATDSVELRAATVEVVDRELARDLASPALGVEELATVVGLTLDQEMVVPEVPAGHVDEFVVNTLTDVWHVNRPTGGSVAVCGWKWGEYGGVLVQGSPGAVCKLCWRIRAGKLGA